MLLATSVLILQQYPRQYRWPCHRCISGIREPGLRVYAGLSLCSRKLWCGTSTLCTGLLMQHLSVPPHQCGGGGMSINERWLYLQATVCTSYTPWTKRPTYSGRFPPLFLDQAEAWRAKDNFFGDLPPPPPPLISRFGSSTCLYGQNCPLGLNGQRVIRRCLYSQGGGGTPHNGLYG